MIDENINIDNHDSDDEIHELGERTDAVLIPDGEEIATSDSLFRLVYRLIEDFQRVRLAHENRVRRVVPAIPPTVMPPRGVPSWEAFFKTSATVLHGEEARVLGLAHRLLKADHAGAWLLRQRGIGPSLAVSILGECWPLSRFRRPRSLWAYSGLHVDKEGKAVRRKKGVRRVVTAEQAQAGVLHTFVPALSCCDKKIADADVHGDPTVDPALHAPIVTDECQYCGIEQRDPRHVKANNWNWRLKTRMWLFASSVLRARSGPWRDVYDRRKTYELERNPEIRPIVAHQRAMRYTEKMLLKDLWRVANGEPPLIGVE